MNGTPETAFSDLVPLEVWLLPLPVAFKASITAIKFGDSFEKMVPALGLNVMVVLASDLLIALAVFIELF